MLLIDRFLSSVDTSPEAPAFITEGGTIGYRSTLALLSSTVRMLHEHGVRPGEVVAVTMAQTPQHILILLALARLGAVSLAVAPLPREADRAALFAEFRVERVISDREDAGARGIAMLRVGSIGAHGDERRLDFGAFVPSAETPMRIGLTSGTAGRRRGVLLTHEGFVRRLGRRFYGEAAAPRVIPPSLHMTSALQLALHALCTGGAVVFPAGYDSQTFVAAIGRHRVTHVTMPPVHLSLMLDALPPDQAPFPSITHVRLQGGMPSPGFIQRVRQTFSPHVCIPYSTTEVGVMAIATPEALELAPRSSGRIAAGARLEIVGEDGRAAAPGVSGEIRVQVDGMPDRYAGEDQGTPPRFRDGWFYPRDRGRMDADGYLFVEGRLDDIMNIGGRKVAPRYVESVLEDFPGVREAAVFVEGEGPEGKRIAAAIVAAAPIDWKKLGAYALKQLGVLAPARYLEVETLPRNAMGKLIRGDLEKWCQGRLS